MEEEMQRERSHITHILPWPPLQTPFTFGLGCMGHMAVAFYLDVFNIMSTECCWQQKERELCSLSIGSRLYYS